MSSNSRVAGSGWVFFATVVLGIAIVPAGAQTAPPAGPRPESLAGAYEGKTVANDGATSALRMDLTFADGQYAGAVDSQSERVAIVSGTLRGDTLTLVVRSGDTTGVMVGRVVEGGLEGTWTLGETAVGFSLTRVGAASGPGGTADPISGVWLGEASVQGQAMPFSLTLRLDGESVTGEIESAMGRVPLTGGAWRDGTLTITFPYVGGEPVSMGAQLRDGRLEGILDYNTGELQGTWVASRK
ncbi:MAG: hypothetical protein AB1806_11290 [Acidobacteriota bacterium]